MPVHSITEKIRFIERVFGKGRLSRSNNFDVRCPICDPLDRTKKKLSIHVESDMNQCWVCGHRARNLIWLIKKFGTSSDLLEYCERFVQNKSTLITADLDISRKAELPSDFSLLVEASNNDPDIMAMKRYVLSRGLSEDDMWYHKLGYSFDFRWQRRVIVPSFNDEGVLNFFAGRAIDDRRSPKYENAIVDMSDVIYNDINIDWKDPLVICEGPFDQMKCPQNSTAVLGSSLLETHMLFTKIVLSSTPIIVAFDADMWNTKTLRVATMLDLYGIEVAILDTRQFGDPGNATKEQMLEASQRARPFSWYTKMETKLDRASRMSLKI